MLPALTKLALLLPLLKMQLWYLTPLHSMTLWIPLLKEKKESASASLTKEIKGMKIGIVKEYFEGINEDVRTAMEKSIETYRQLGAEIVECSIPEIKYGLPVYYILACAEASSNLGRYDGIRYGYKVPHYEDINEMICKTRSEGFGAEVKHRILLGTYVLSAGYYDAYYKKAQNLRGVIVNAFKRVFETCDVILAPTVPMTSFERGQTQKTQYKHIKPIFVLFPLILPVSLLYLFHADLTAKACLLVYS